MTEEQDNEHFDARIGRAVLAIVAGVAISVVGAVVFNTYLKSGNRSDDLQASLQVVRQDVYARAAEIRELGKDLGSIDLRITKLRERVDAIAEKVNTHNAEVAKNEPLTLQRWDAERRVIDSERAALIEHLERDEAAFQRQIDAINKRLEYYGTRQ